MQGSNGLARMLSVLSEDQRFDSEGCDQTRMGATEMQTCYDDEFKILELMRTPFPIKDIQSGCRSEKTLQWLRQLKHWFLSPIRALWAWHFGKEHDWVPVTKRGEVWLMYLEQV